jgi:hypothetical protein
MIDLLITYRMVCSISIIKVRAKSRDPLWQFIGYTIIKMSVQRVSYHGHFYRKSSYSALKWSKEKPKRLREIFVINVFLYVFLIIFAVVHWFQETWSKNRSMFFCCLHFRWLVEKLTYICIYVYIFPSYFSFIFMILCG